MEFLLLAFGLGSILAPSSKEDDSADDDGDLSSANAQSDGDGVTMDLRLLDDPAAQAGAAQPETAQPDAAQPTPAPGAHVTGTWRWEHHYGTSADDRYDLRGGNDLAAGRDGNDTLIGGAGRDTLRGDSGDDFLRGGPDNDLLYAGYGADVVFGGSGSDTIHGGSGGSMDRDGTSGDGRDVLDGGTGNDSIEGASDHGTGVIGSRLVGGGGNDTLVSHSAGDTLIGGRGDDVVNAQIGGDVWLDGQGGGHGADHLRMTFADRGAQAPYEVPPEPLRVHDFQLGHDRFEMDHTDNFTLTVQDHGTQLLLMGNGVTLAVFANCAGASLSDLMPDYVAGPAQSASGTDAADTLAGGNGADTLAGGGGSDSLTGAGGNDSLLGGEGDDSLAGGAGNDTLLGGNGNDRLEGGGWNDSLDGGAGNDTLLGHQGHDTLLGGDGNDKIEGGASDSLYGGAGNDTLSVGNAYDTPGPTGPTAHLWGGDGNDDLTSFGVDQATLEGGAGSDTLFALSGDATLLGGADTDAFLVGHYHAPEGSFVTIGDFANGEQIRVYGASSQPPLTLTQTLAADGSGVVLRLAGVQVGFVAGVNRLLTADELPQAYG